MNLNWTEHLYGAVGDRYLIRVRPYDGVLQDGKCYVGEWQIFQIMESFDATGAPEEPLLVARKGARSNMDGVPVTDLDNAEVLIHGGVKWDGCANWAIDNGATAIHHCEASHLKTLLEAITLAHRLAAALPTAGDGDDYCASWLADEEVAS
jgi:hypothetical protein